VFGALLAGVLFALLGYAESTVADLAGLVFVAVAAAAIALGRQPNGVAGAILDLLGRVPDPRALFDRRPRFRPVGGAPALELEGER
jgi:hypothetical protein